MVGVTKHKVSHSLPTVVFPSKAHWSVVPRPKSFASEVYHKVISTDISEQRGRMAEG
jgi:hypothetical protein